MTFQLLRPKILEPALTLLFLLHPSTQQILEPLSSKSIWDPTTSHLPTVPTLVPWLPSLLSWKILTAPHWAPRFHLCSQQSSFFSKEQPECSLKNISQMEPLGACIPNKRPLLTTGQKPHVTSIPTTTPQTLSPLAPSPGPSAAPEHPTGHGRASGSFFAGPRAQHHVSLSLSFLFGLYSHRLFVPHFSPCPYLLFLTDTRLCV